ncbi:MAG: hypothetical protein GY898_12925 [Proteobacteria bacterium]|nr:hypothetical protein [Pseudomonadota bacterium]
MTNTFAKVLGTVAEGPEAAALVAQYGLLPHITPDGERFFIGGGVRLWTTETEPITIPTITLFGPDAVQQPDDGDAGVFADTLPHGLTWGARLDDVAALFPEPPARMGAGLGDRSLFGDWAGFWVGTHGVHTDFGADGLRQIMLMLNPPGWP